MSMPHVDHSPRISHLRIALALAGLGAIAAILLLPYVFALMPKLRSQIHVEVALFAVIQGAQAGVLTLLLGWIGLRLGYRLGLDAPWLREFLYCGTTKSAAEARWLFAGGLGAGVGLLCLLLLAMAPLGDLASEVAHANWWQGLLASLYGGVVEETICRLFLVSLFVWIAARLTRSARPTAVWYWVAIAAAALIFGTAHLPALAQVAAIDAANIARVIALNALCGIAFGWLFWRYGLEHAMAAHFSADIVLHVAGPLLA